MDHAELGRLALSLAIGLLIGLERGWARRERPDGERSAGLRTFGIIGLLGGVAASLARELGPWAFAALAFSVGALAACSHVVAASPRRRGLTTEVAALAAFGLGALAALGKEQEAAAAAVVLTALLGFKPLLHGWVERLGRVEFHAALQFLLITVVILPILPDDGYGPWKSFNPRQVWTMVVVISGLSFAGYAAIKLLGERAGIAAASTLGGFVSSTAVALALARRDRLHPASWRLHAGGIVLASAIMFPRVLAEVAAVNRSLIPLLAWPILAAALIGLLAAGLLIGRSGGEHGEAPELKNPLQLAASLVFGFSIAGVTFATVGLRQVLGEGGAYATAALAGIMDVDAVTLSMSRLSRGGDLPAQAAANAILIAVAANTASKAAIAAVVARGRLGWICVAVLAACLAAGAAALRLS